MQPGPVVRSMVQEGQVGHDRTGQQITENEQDIQQQAESAQDEHMLDDDYQLSLRLQHVPEDVRGLLDPFNTSIGPLELNQWNEKQQNALIDSLQSQHLAVLMAKRIHSNVLPVASVLTWHHLSFIDGEDVVFDDLSGMVEPGRMTGILGGPDSGLTPLLNVLTDMSAQTAGCCSI